jgi:hypothetical protein
VQLQRLLVDFYPSVVASDFLAGSGLGVEFSGTNRQLAVRQIEQLSSRHRNPQSKHVRRIRGLYCLISRSIQALALIDILCSAHEEEGLLVPWISLENLSFRSLVVSPGVHDRVEKMLVDLMGRAFRGGNVVIADQITVRLSVECFQYFSAGDLYYYQASRSLYKVAPTPNSFDPESLSPAINQLILDCIELLCKAASYWKALEDVKEGFKEGSSQAFGECSSYLTTSCELLRTYGEVSRKGIVTLCATAAINFDILCNSLIHPSSEEDWDRAMYHGGSALAEAGSVEGKSACYNCLIKEIMAVRLVMVQMKGEGREEATAAVVTMIEFSLTACDDPLYRALLFDRCLGEDSELLISLNPSSFLEDFLRLGDPMLLYTYDLFFFSSFSVSPSFCCCFSLPLSLALSHYAFFLFLPPIDKITLTPSYYIFPGIICATKCS